MEQRNEQANRKPRNAKEYFVARIYSNYGAHYFTIF
jgi:hypothetical protein